MDREKKITPITAQDIQAVINSSVMGEGNRLVGNATEQKQILVRPIANTDNKPNVMSFIQRVADEAEKAIEEVAEKSADISTEGLQPSIDEALETASKTIVGAINELRRQLAKATVLELTEVVSELPKVGEPNKFYLIAKETTDANDLYDEWIWVNKGTKDNPNYKWEYAGAKKIEFNADEYLKKTNLGFGFKIEDDILKLESYVGALESRIDYPVLGTTMDGAWKECAVNRRCEWTDEEKAAACETIGAESKGYAKWKLIGETEITQEMIDEAGAEGITGIIIDLGKPVEKWFGETWVRLETPIPNFNVNLPLYCKFGATVEAAMAWDEGNGCVIFSAQSEAYGALFKNYPNTVNLFTNWHDNIPRGTAMQNTAFGAYNYPYYGYATSNNMSHPIKGNRYLAATTRHANGRGAFPVGTKLKLYGRFAE